MSGKFLQRGAIIDTIKSEHRMNSLRRRTCQTDHPVKVTSCGCPDPNCGAWHTIIEERTIPTNEECNNLLGENTKVKKLLKKKHNKTVHRTMHSAALSGEATPD